MLWHQNTLHHIFLSNMWFHSLIISPVVKTVDNDVIWLEQTHYRIHFLQNKRVCLSQKVVPLVNTCPWPPPPTLTLLLTSSLTGRMKVLTWGLQAADGAEPQILQLVPALHFLITSTAQGNRALLNTDSQTHSSFKVEHSVSFRISIPVRKEKLLETPAEYPSLQLTSEIRRFSLWGCVVGFTDQPPWRATYLTTLDSCIQSRIHFLTSTCYFQ